MRISAAVVTHISSTRGPSPGVLVEEASVESFSASSAATAPPSPSLLAKVSSSTSVSGGPNAEEAFTANKIDDLAQIASLKRPRNADAKELEADRQQRCRERNRIHARKTRQRKKAQMEGLKNMADRFKAQQLALVHAIHEKQTANILLSIQGGSDPAKETENDASLLEQLLARSSDDIPDAKRVPDLPALDMPAHLKIDASLKDKEEVSEADKEAIEKIRRERNRLHAKRTRDRKRLFMQEMDAVCRQLASENETLMDYLASLDADHSVLAQAAALAHEWHEESAKSTPSTPTLQSPSLGPVVEDRDAAHTLLSAAAMFLERSSPDHSAVDDDETASRSSKKARHV